MKTANIEIKLKDSLSYSFDYDDGKEYIYSTYIESLIRDDDGYVLAVDDSWQEHTKHYYISKGKKYINREDSRESIIKHYLFTIKNTFETIQEYKEDFYKFCMSLHDSCLDREDIQYNEDLWYQYKPLYDLLTKNGYNLELKCED